MSYRDSIFKQELDGAVGQPFSYSVPSPLEFQQ